MSRGKGGSRTGTPGNKYSQRLDLQANAGQPLPVQTPPSTSYGQAAASARSQAVVPLAPQAAPTPPPVPTPGPAGAQPGAIAPGGFGDPLRPTERPGEPVTAGLPTGAGPGPEVLTSNAFQSSPLQTAVGMLASLGDNTSPQLRALRTQLQATLQNQAPR